MITFEFRIPKESLRNEIQRLVQAYPLLVRHIPDALNIFTVISDNNDRQCEVKRRLKKKNKPLVYLCILDISYSYLGTS